MNAVQYYRLAFGTLFVFQIGLFLHFHFQYQVISRDSLIFLEMAQHFAQNQWPLALDTGQHPLYPLLMACLAPLLQPYFSFSNPVDVFILAGQLLSFLAYFASSVAILLLTRQLFSPCIGILAYFLILFQPYYCREAGDVLTDLPYLAFYLWGIYSLWQAICFKRFFYFFLAGVFGSAAYLVRPEGLLIPLTFLWTGSLILGGFLQQKKPQNGISLTFWGTFFFLGILGCREFYSFFPSILFFIPVCLLSLGILFGWAGYLFFAPTFPWLSSWRGREILLATFLFALAFLPATASYMRYIGGISLKQRNIGERLMLFLKKADPGQTVAHVPDSIRHQQVPEIQQIALEGIPFRTTERNEDSVLLTFLETAHPYISFFFVGVLALRFRQLWQCLRQRKTFPVPAEGFIYFAFGLNFLMLLAVLETSGYTARRHTFSLIALCLPYGAFGLYHSVRVLFQKIPEWLSAPVVVQGVLRSARREFWYKKGLFWGGRTTFGFWLAILLAFSALILVLKGLKPFEIGHHYILEQSRYLEKQYGAGQVQMGNLPRLAFYARGKNVPFTKPVGQNGLTDLQTRSVNLIVIKEDFLTSGPYRVIVEGQYRLLQFWLKQGWIEPVTLPESVQDPKNPILLFRVHQEKLPKVQNK